MIQNKGELHYRNMEAKYPVTDRFLSLRGRTVKVALYGEFMPNFGAITRVDFEKYLIKL